MNEIEQPTGALARIAPLTATLPNEANASGVEPKAHSPSPAPATQGQPQSETGKDIMRAGYVLAMRLLQSDRLLDAEEQSAIELFTTPNAFGGSPDAVEAATLRGQATRKAVQEHVCSFESDGGPCAGCGQTFAQSLAHRKETSPIGKAEAAEGAPVQGQATSGKILCASLIKMGQRIVELLEERDAILNTAKAFKRPNWKKLYGYEPSTPRPQELVSVTRHTADLAMSALKDRMEKEYYDNDAAACRELNVALTSSDGTSGVSSVPPLGDSSPFLSPQPEQ